MPQRMILHPATGVRSYGIVPAYNRRNIVIPEGEICLQRGRHFGPNKGFGAAHIWAEHQAEVMAAGFATEDDVCGYVASIVRAGSQINYEGSSWTRTRVMVVRTRAGLAVLEYKNQRNDAFWTVITAYSSNKSHGSRIGTVG